ncbi:hypothetical protein L1887_51725 [Cichorium endivia]|nr:hypothetical protein L1887_51725 [Cichorium endivia]
MPASWRSARVQPASEAGGSTECIQACHGRPGCIREAGQLYLGLAEVPRLLFVCQLASPPDPLGLAWMHAAPEPWDLSPMRQSRVLFLSESSCASRPKQPRVQGSSP